jgi:4-hydroxybenzoate polyprenyltransferase/phosphoserine phosphatase
VVDLDGTLIASDSLVESLLALLKRQPWCIFLLPAWALKGKVALKAEIARRVHLRVETLPYRADLIDHLRTEREAGRTLVLATAAHHSIADAVAAHLKIFDEVVATDGQINTKGTAKRDALLARFGMRGFDYIGDDRADVPVWGASRVAHVAGNRRGLPKLAQMAGAALGQPFVSAGPGLRSWIRAIRVHQWVKNVLLFVPMVTAHRVDARTALTVAVSFLAFSLLASGTYLINDLFDLDADRKHPSKRSRPFASGKIPLTQGVVAALLLIVAGFGLGTILGIRPVIYLLLYFVVTIAYSLRLKHHPILDVVALAFLYTLRILAGGAAADVRISQWLFQFSVFLFLSLALVKRYSELHRLQLEGNGDARARGYRPTDLTVVSQSGISAGLIAGLVLALYINSPDVQLLYAKPHVLWAICPLFVYWIVRVWLIANRGGLNEDPILFAFRDRVSYLVGLTILIVMLLAMLPHVS